MLDERLKKLQLQMMEMQLTMMELLTDKAKAKPKRRAAPKPKPKPKKKRAPRKAKSAPRGFENTKNEKTWDDEFDGTKTVEPGWDLEQTMEQRPEKLIGRDKF